MEQDILDYAEKLQCQELHMTVDQNTGLRGIIAIHSTTLGPALGGCRCIAYPSTTAAAIDAIRLAQGMSYKAALSKLPLGGGKMVIIKPPVIRDRVAFFKAVGRFVNTLQGRYITAVDSGTSVQDMDIVASETPYVTSTTQGSFSVADPSVLTALGVERGIQAAVKYKLKKDSLEGVHIAIQGLGHAGYNLAQRLHSHGAKLSVFDINPEVMKKAEAEFQAKPVSSFHELIQLESDVFAPSALGGILNDQTIPLIKAGIIAGCANNQLEEPRHGSALLQRGILYAPDYVINAGGLIYVAGQLSHISEESTTHHIEHIYDILLEIFERADRAHRPTSEVADDIARERLQPKVREMV